MLKVLFFTFALASGALDAQAFSDRSCAEQGKEFGAVKYREIAGIDSHCFEKAKREMTARTQSSSYDGQVVVRALKNILFISTSDGTKDNLYKISGPMSGLQNIKSVAVSSDKKYIAVLNEKISQDGVFQQEVLVFQTGRNGNVAPYRVNQSPLLSDAQSIYFSADASEILALKRKARGSSIIAFKASADSRSANLKRRPAGIVIQGEFELPLSLVKDENLLIMLEPNGDISGKELVGMKAIGSWKLSKEETEVSKPSALRYDPVKRVLQVVDGNGQESEFKI